MRRLAVLLSGTITALLVVSSPTGLVLADSLTWEYTGGPEGAAVISFLTTPAGTLLAGTENGGLYRSTDGGASWEAAELPWPCCNYNVPSLAAATGVIYAGTWGGGVYRSTDDGLTWSAAGWIPEGYPIIDALAACRFGQRVYAGGNFGVARSDDGGDNWVLDGDGLSYGWVRDLALRGTTVYALLDNGIYRRSEGSTTWEAWNDGLADVHGQQSLRTATDALFLATHAGGVYHLDCADSSWVVMSDGLIDNYVDVVLEADQTFYAGNMGGGASRWDPVTLLWEEINDGLWARDIRTMTRRGLTPWAGTWGAGVFEFDRDTDTWTVRDYGLHSPQVTALVVDGSNVIAGVYGGGIGRSADLGGTWSFSNTGLNELTVLCLTRDGTSIYAGTWNGVWKSTDHGATWSGAGLTAHGVYCVEVLSGVLTAGTYDGLVYTSTTGGSSWSTLGTGLPGGPIHGVARLDTVQYAAAQGYGVYRLPDGGTTWTGMSTGLPTPYPLCLAVNQGSLFVGLDGYGVCRWNGTAGEWQSAGLEHETIFCLANNGIQLLAGSWGQLNGTIDGGANWTDEHSGLKEWQAVKAIGIGTSHLFAGLEGGGVWRAGGPVTGVRPEPMVPTALSLRVAPNPFSPSARIVFTLDRPAEVRLSVYDIAGRSVAEIPCGLLPAGMYERTWSGIDSRGQKTAAGMYLIRLKAGEREMTTKAIHVR